MGQVQMEAPSRTPSDSDKFEFGLEAQIRNSSSQAIGFRLESFGFQFGDRHAGAAPGGPGGIIHPGSPLLLQTELLNNVCSVNRRLHSTSQMIVLFGPADQSYEVRWTLELDVAVVRRLSDGKNETATSKRSETYELIKPIKQHQP